MHKPRGLIFGYFDSPFLWDSFRYDLKYNDPNPYSTAIAERGRAAAGERYRPF